MIRNRLGKKRWNLLKYAGLTVSLALVCTLVFFVLWKTDVFGKFQAEEPYVVGDAQVKSVIVTSEGSNQKGKDGSGAMPLSAEVPTCEGKKGSKTNPFVVLEIVPEKSQQQLIYLGQDEDGEKPLDVMKIGIDTAKKQDKTYAQSSSMMDQDKLKGDMGQWFSNNSYSVYKIGSNSKEEMPFAYIDKLYTLKFTDEEIREKTGDDTAAEGFAEVFKETEQQYATNWHNIKKLSELYPEMFEKDSKGKNIRDIALDDRYNWKASREKVILSEEDAEEYKSGYMVMIEPGKGDFGFASKDALLNWEFEKTGAASDRWVYVKDDKELEERFPEYKENYRKSGAIYANGYSYTKEDGSIVYWADLSEMWKDIESTAYTGLMYKIEEWKPCRYLKSQEQSEYKYEFNYYGVRNHNILKRALFNFNTKEEYDDFHMEVICMTPAELNKLCEPDNEETVDMIERADMYYIQSGDFDGNLVNETGLLQELYYNYVKPGATKPNEEVTFYENDLEWSLCQKIIQRQSSVKTLPLVFNQMVGKLLEGGISRSPEKETHMYVTKGIEGDPSSNLTDVPAKGSRNNLSKLYLISIQFDLLARKENDETLQSTFMEDIYPNIKTISLPNENGVKSGTAKQTGYYDGTVASPRKLCTCDKPQEFKERVYYLWNTYTFIPVDINVQLNGNLSDDTKKHMVSLGYQESYFVTNDGNAFSGSSSPSHQSGSDGKDDKNVAIVSDPSNSNTNHSSFLGNKGDNGNIANNAFEVIFQILNNYTPIVNPVTVSAEEQRKMYVKIADDAVMLDHEADGKLKKDKDIYVKVRFWNNENNKSGQVKQIRLVKEDGQKRVMKLYKDKTFTEECENWEKDGQKFENQYVVPVDDAYLTGYIKFKLSEWKNGFNVLQFDTVGWVFYVPKKGETEAEAEKKSSKPDSYEISIIGKTLFDLE